MDILLSVAGGYYVSTSGRGVKRSRLTVLGFTLFSSLET